MNRELRIRSSNRFFPEDLTEELSREIWKILETVASVDAMLAGSFVVVRAALGNHLHARIRRAGSCDDGTWIFALKVAPGEPDTFGMEAAAAIATAQEDLFQRLASVTRVAGRIAEAVEAALAPYRTASAQATMAKAIGRSEARARAALTREPALAESRVT